MSNVVSLRDALQVPGTVVDLANHVFSVEKCGLGEAYRRAYSLRSGIVPIRPEVQSEQAGTEITPDQIRALSVDQLATKMVLASKDENGRATLELGLAQNRALLAKLYRPSRPAPAPPSFDPRELGLLSHEIGLAYTRGELPAALVQDIAPSDRNPVMVGAHLAGQLQRFAELGAPDMARVLDSRIQNLTGGRLCLRDGGVKFVTR